MRILFLCLFFLNFINYCFSQTEDAFFKHFDSNDGLSDDHVTALLKDKTGFLWVGTANGLNRYDGYNFKNYLPDFKNSQNTISNEYICDIVQSKNEIIWIGTNDGLNRYDPRTQKFEVYKYEGNNQTLLPSSLIRDLYLDERDDLWVICDNRDPAILNKKTGKFRTIPWKINLEKTIPKSKNQSYKAIYSIKPKSESEIYLLTNFGLWSYNIQSEKFTFHHIENNAKKDYNEAFLFKILDDPTFLYGIRDQGLFKIKPSTEVGNLIVNSVFNYKGDHWLLTNSGIFLMNDKGILTDFRVRKNNTIHASVYYSDVNSTLWLGGDSGLYLYDPNFQHYKFKQLDENNKFYKLLYTHQDSFLFALSEQRNRLLIFNKNKLLKTIKLKGITSLLFEDSFGQIWIGDGNKLYTIDRKTYNLINFPIELTVFSGNEVEFLDMAEDSNGNRWFANDYNGIIIYNSKNRSWWNPGKKEEFISTNVAHLVADHTKKTMWIGTQEYGVYKYDETIRKFTLYRPEENNVRHSLGAYIITSICKDSVGNIWIATDHGGLSKFNDKNNVNTAFTTFGMENGLPSNQVFGLECDRLGNIWAGTSKGLAHINTLTDKIIYYTKNEGLPGELMDHPLSIDSEGNIIYPSEKGFYYFNPKSFTKSNPTYNLNFSSFKIFDKQYIDPIDINYQKAIDLNYRQNFFNFEVFSDDLSHVHKNHFSYQLLNYDKQWTSINAGNSGSYTNVPPGEYTLLIRGRKDGEWNTIPLQLKINIHPPFWMTWWFRTIFGLLLVGIIYLIYRSRINKIRREEVVKTEFNKKIAQTEMTALRAQMNPHFVFNCLSSINHFILANRADDASAYLTKFSRLIRLILDNSRCETIDLKKELETLQLYIDMEAMRFGNKFTYQIIVDENVRSENIQIPPMLIQPYVENAIWHGLMHNKEKGKLLIRSVSNNNKLIITIEDNGVGRLEAGKLKSKSASIHKSHGTQLTSERINLMNQLYNAQAMVTIEDLNDENSTVSGTRVILTIQLNNES